MAGDWDWREARRLAGYVRAAGRTGLHRSDADRLMGGTVDGRRQAFGLAYSRRWIDVCGAWLVQPPRRAEPAPAASDPVAKQEPAAVLFKPHGSGFRRTA